MGLEYITQPQVFTAPITALQGIQGINEAYPLLTTYQYWTSTAVVPASTFPIPGTWTMLSEPGSFIVAIGGIIQPATEYSIDRNNRKVNFTSLISADLEVSFTQLATHAPSSQSFNYIQSVSASFTNLSATNLLVTNLTALQGLEVNGQISLSGTTDAVITNYQGTEIILSPVFADWRTSFRMTGLSGVNPNTAHLYVNNNTGYFINNSGNFGINTTSPTEKLTVAGNILATGTASVSALNIVSGNVFSKTTFNNLVSALAINVNGTTLYLPLLSAI